MTSLFELLNRLAHFGVSVRAEGESLKILRPATWTSWDDTPEECRPHLRELKVRRDEVMALLKWDEGKAFQAWRVMLDRMNEKYLPGALEWAEEFMPEIERQLAAAEDLFDISFKVKDMAGVYRATSAFENAMKALIQAYRKERGHGQMAGHV